MSWDPVWEELFRTRDWGKYPPEELIRFIARNYFAAPDRKQVRVLEMGCGTGANVWFLAREGFDAYGIDGSATAIRKGEQRLQKEGLTAHLRVGDVLSLAEDCPAGHFDAVIDVGCLVCNRLAEVRSIVDQAIRLLKPGGRLFSMLLARGTYGDGTGKEIEPGTFVDIKEGTLAGKGLVHLFTLEEVQALFGRLSELQIETSEYTVEDRRHRVKHWIAQGRK
jgi:SAM-dependent methyltransferase